MKIKTSELNGAALDWAVAKCVGRGYPYPASTDWSVGGPIVDKEGICISRTWPNEHPMACIWVIGHAAGRYAYKQRGPTMLIAAMRCYVASKLGDTVDVPEELCQ